MLRSSSLFAVLASLFAAGTGFVAFDFFPSAAAAPAKASHKKTSSKKTKSKKAKAKKKTVKKAKSSSTTKSHAKKAKKSSTTSAHAHSKKKTTTKKKASHKKPSGGVAGGSTGGSSGSTNLTGSTTVLFAPNGAAHTLENDIIAKLGNARSTVDVAMYTFDSGPLADACVAAAQRGVTVRVLLDSAQAKQSLSKDVTLKSGGCSVEYIQVSGGAMGTKFHHKFCILDGSTLMTGSYNWTTSADEENYENYLTLTDGAIVNAFATEFDSLWTSKTGGVGSTQDVVFAPSGSAKAIENRIAEEIGGARSQIAIAMYEFTSKVVSDALVAAIGRGVKVWILSDANEANVNQSALDAISQAGGNEEGVFLRSSGFARPEFHDKYCVIDGSTVITGSFNWNIQQDEKGYENVIVLHDANLAKQYIQNFDSIWGDSSVAH